MVGTLGSTWEGERRASQALVQACSAGDKGDDAAEGRPRAAHGVGEGKIDAAPWEEAMQMLRCAD